MVYERTCDDKTDFIVHLLSEPQTENMILEYPAMPPIIKDAKISFKIDKDCRPVSAWAMRPYDFDCSVPIRLER